MDSTDEHLTVREVVLLVVDAAGGKLETRTTVQKRTYFAGLAIDENLGHHAHYYGPYSRPVESALVNSAFAGDLAESVESLHSWSGADVRKFNNSLSYQGRAEVARIRLEQPTLSANIDNIVERLGKLVPGWAQHPLSLAAKVDYIASQEGGEVSASTIPGLARGFGWNVSPDDVEQSVAVLVGLGRAQAPSSA